MDAASAAGVALVGDYRSSSAPKAWLATLVGRRRGTALFLDVFAQRDAFLVDLWRAGRLSTRELLTLTRFASEIATDFAPYAALLRRGGVELLEAPVRSDRASRAARFRLAARRMAEHRRTRRWRRAIVLAGQAYLARGFFPAMLRRALRLRLGDIVTVTFSADAARPASLGGGRYVLPLGPSRRLARTSARDDARVDLDATLTGVLDRLCSKLGIDPFRHRVNVGDQTPVLRDVYPLVLQRGQSRTAAKVLRARGLDTDDVRRSLGVLAREGSLFVPRASVILVGKLELVGGAEEAAHFLNFALRGDLLAPQRSSFYQDVWDEAIGFLGSKLLHPRRPSPTLSALRRSRPQGILREARSFVLAHARMEASYGNLREPPFRVRAGLAGGGELLFHAHHMLGYMLGSRLHRASRSRGPRWLARLFATRLDGPIEAFGHYLRVTRELR